MRRTTVLVAAMTSVLGIALCLCGQTPQGEPETKPNPLLGTWELVSYKYGDQKEFSEFPKNLRRIRMFTETHHIWFQFDRDVGRIQDGAGGLYTFKNGTLTESKDFAFADMIRYRGKKHVYTIQVEGDTYRQSGALADGLRIEEVWRRVKLTEGSAEAEAKQR